TKNDRFLRHFYSTTHQISLNDDNFNNDSGSKFKKYSKFIYKYFAWCLFGSCALNLSMLKSNYNSYKERMEFRINDLEEIIQRLKNEKNINDTQISNKNQSDNNDDNVFDNK
ncbi:3341_t:CDS:1, partial [Entrophospora sp. SA101]